MVYYKNSVAINLIAKWKIIVVWHETLEDIRVDIEQDIFRKIGFKNKVHIPIQYS